MFSVILPLFISLLAATAVAILVFTIIRAVSGAQNRQTIAAMPKYTLRDHSTPEQLAEVDEAVDTSLFLSIGQRLLNARYRAWLVNKLQIAGQRGNVALAALLTKKVTYAVIGAMFGALFLSKGVSMGIAVILMGAVAGFFVADLLVISDGQNREQEMDLAMPDAIDLLNLCVESGLSFEAGIARVSVSLNGPVAEEFGALLSEMQLGKSRVEAMNELADRTRSKGMQQFLSALLQVDRLGVPISGVLAEQASEMRSKRKDKAREQGQKVTIKILMPLMLCFLPAMFVVVLGPAIYQLIQTMALL